MTRRKTPSNNAALSATIQMTGVLRRQCVTGYNNAYHRVGIDTMRRVFNLLRAQPVHVSGSAEHHLLSNYAFFASDDILGERSVFVRYFNRIAHRDLRVMREAVMGAPFGAWECVSGAKQAGATWRLVGPAELVASPVASGRKGSNQTISTQGVVALSDPTGASVAAQKGEVRAGWMLALEHAQPGKSARIRSQLAGSSALLFSMPLQPQAAARLKKAVKERAWHGRSTDGKPPRFFRADYERDVLTQAVVPEFESCGLGPYYFLPIRIRDTFPDRFRSELLRKIGNIYTRDHSNWHLDLARATTDEKVDAFLATLEAARKDTDRKIHGYTGDSVAPADLRRLFSDTELLALMGAGPRGEVDLSGFPPVESHQVELLDLELEWLEAEKLHPYTPISAARTALASRPDDVREAFAESVDRHLARLRWVSLMKAHRQALSSKDAEDVPAEKRALVLPGYNLLRDVIDALFRPVFKDRPIREAFAFLKGRLDKLEEALQQNLRWDELEEKEVLTLVDLPEHRRDLGRIPGIGPATVEKIESQLFDEILAWPRTLDSAGRAQHLAGAHLSDGLDELGDLFD